MTIPELQTMIYTNVLVRLKDVVDEFGNHIPSLISDEEHYFQIGYQVRDREFHHNYQRNKFLRTRDRYLFSSRGSKRIHILTERHKNEVILYDKNIREVFGKDSDKAIKLMTKMLNRVYDTVRLDSRSPVSVYDQENGRTAYNETFYEV